MIYRYPLCGKAFSEAKMKGASGCLYPKPFDLLCCPDCGYRFKERSVIVDFLNPF